MTAADILLLVTAGLLGGAVNAVAGGGSLIVFPALLATGFGTVAANVTNSVAQWPGYLGSVLGFGAELKGQRQRLLALTLSAVLGGTAGCVLLLTTPAEAFDAVVPVLVLLASLLLAVQPLIAKWIAPPEEGGSAKRFPLYIAIFFSSIYGGYFGGALGVILIGVLALTVKDSLRRLNALKSALSLVVATVTVVAFGIYGPVDWLAVAVIAPSTLIGGFVGAKVARRLNDTVLRICVVVFGVGVAVYLFSTS
ncbi:MAG: sulfite exporter TauE/SafE family protein [Geodermatophilaceae bacterium]